MFNSYVAAMFVIISMIDRNTTSQYDSLRLQSRKDAPGNGNGNGKIAKKINHRKSGAPKSLAQLVPIASTSHTLVYDRYIEVVEGTLPSFNEDLFRACSPTGST